MGIVEGPGGAETERGRAVRLTGGELVVASQINVMTDDIGGVSTCAW